MGKKAARKLTGKKAPAKRGVKKASGQTPGEASLVKALGRRASAVAEELTSEAGAAAERRLLAEARDAAAGGGLPEATVLSIYRELIAAARRRSRPARAAYLGPAFSFTHLAAVERFGSAADLVPVETIKGVFEEVNRGHCEFGVVPIENSTDGRIVDTLDMFTRLPLTICGEVQLRIHHHLLSRTPRGEVTEIYSKPQALSQCRDWLAGNMPGAVRHAVTSTSTAAQLAAEKPGAAAVASRQAGVQYGLDVLADCIEDAANNVTRFAVIGNERPAKTGRDRTSLLLELPNRPGALVDALERFRSGKLNLTWIESFPARGGESGTYLFFVDVDGHHAEAKLARVLSQLREETPQLHLLGSYPVGRATDG